MHYQKNRRRPIAAKEVLSGVIKLSELISDGRAVGCDVPGKRPDPTSVASRMTTVYDVLIARLQQSEPKLG